jgi:predicted transcriptional regulator of viral defense system
MLHDQRSPLSGYMETLLSKGACVFTADQALTELGINRGAFLDASARLQKKGGLLHPRQGFYVVVPPQYASIGSPPVDWFIDDLMRHEKSPYYVGLLKAAELQGATHQAVMSFQIITNKRLPKIRMGRNALTFSYRNDITILADGIEDRKTETGKMKVATASLTALDLLRYTHVSAGLDNVVTVLADLVPKIETDLLAKLSSAFDRATVQRLGYLLEWVDLGVDADPLYASLMARGRMSWTELDRVEARDPDFAPHPIVRDNRWKIIVRRHPEVDE